MVMYIFCFFGLSCTSTTSRKSNSVLACNAGYYLHIVQSPWDHFNLRWATKSNMVGLQMGLYYIVLPTFFLRIMNLIWIPFDRTIQLKVPSILNDVQITIYLLSLRDYWLWVPLGFLALHSERKVSFIKEMQKAGKQRTNCEWDSWFSQSMVITHNCRSKSIVNQCHLQYLHYLNKVVQEVSYIVI